MKKTDQITILGITGYTGSWLAQQLTQAGYMNIVGTYRNESKMAALIVELPNLQGIEADLLQSPDQVTAALRGSKWVFNNSAPFTGNEQSVADYVHTKQTMVDNLMRSINQVKSVKKLVHLGSAAAIYMGIKDPKQIVIDEDTWPDLAHMDRHYEPFIDMKVEEERRLRDMAAVIDLDVTVLHPTNIVGPSLLTWQHDMIYSYLHGNGPLVNGPFDCIDVRDVAGMEIALMMNSDSNVKRMLGLGFTSDYQTLIESVKTNFDTDKLHQLFGELPTLVAVETALALWQSVKETSFYKDQAWRLNPQSILRTKYPDFYQYQYTDAQTTFIQAVAKMINDDQV